MIDFLISSLICYWSIEILTKKNIRPFPFIWFSFICLGCRSEGNLGSKETNCTSKAKKAKVSSSGSTRSFDRTSSPSEFLIPVPLIYSSDFPSNIINTTNNGNKQGNVCNNSVIKLTFCTSEGGLPDNFAATLRIFVNVWESGLNGMDDDAVKLINLSIRDFVKNILTAVLTYRSSHKTTSDGFRYGFGSPSANPLQLNTYPSISSSSSFSDSVNRSANIGLFNYSSDSLTSSIIHHPNLLEQDALHQVAVCDGNRSWIRNQESEETREDFQIREECWKGRREESINLWHLFHALKKNRNCISSNSIYATNMTRIITRLNHDKWHFTLMECLFSWTVPDALLCSWRWAEAKVFRESLSWNKNEKRLVRTVSPPIGSGVQRRKIVSETMMMVSSGREPSSPQIVVTYSFLNDIDWRPLNGLRLPVPCFGLEDSSETHTVFPVESTIDLFVMRLTTGTFTKRFLDLWQADLIRCEPYTSGFRHEFATANVKSPSFVYSSNLLADSSSIWYQNTTTT